MTREQALVIGRQLADTVYPEMMTNIFRLSKGGFTLPLMTDIVRYLNMLSDLPNVLEPEEDPKLQIIRQDLVLYIEETIDRVLRMFEQADDKVMCFRLRNAMFSLDGIQRMFFSYAEEKFPGEKTEQKQEDQEDERQPEEIH